jgi:hypothetical protein
MTAQEEAYMSYYCSECHVNRRPYQTNHRELPDVWQAHRPDEAAKCDRYLRFERYYDEREQDLRAGLTHETDQTVKGGNGT